jgi:hypothetical protein
MTTLPSGTFTFLLMDIAGLRAALPASGSILLAGALMLIFGWWSPQASRRFA